MTARAPVLASMVTLLAVLPVHALATTIRVPADQPTLQAGIDAAAAGDTVLAAPGTYTGPGNRDLDFGGKDLVLSSEQGAAATIIDCEEAGRGIHLHSGETSAAVIDGFTITHAKSLGNDRANWGGGIRCDDSAPTIVRCVLAENTATWGGGMALTSFSSTRPTVVECTITGNTGLSEGGGLLCDGVVSEITDCAFSGNQGGNSGGAMVCYGAATQLTLTRCTFSENTAGFGGAVWGRECSVTLDDCILTENEAARGGGMHLDASTSFALNRCILAGNPGGAVSSYGDPTHPSTLAISGCTLFENLAGAAGAAGIRLQGQVTATVDNTIIADGREGPAVFCVDAFPAVTLRCSDLHGNAGGDWTDCIAGQAGQDGNLSENPLFCDAPAGDFRIALGSPCAPAQSGACGLIGALDAAACTPNAVEPATWGAIKAAYGSGGD